MIVTIAEQFTSDPSDRERSPTIIWKPGLRLRYNVSQIKNFVSRKLGRLLYFLSQFLAVCLNKCSVCNSKGNANFDYLNERHIQDLNKMSSFYQPFWLDFKKPCNVHLFDAMLGLC